MGELYGKVIFNQLLLDHSGAPKPPAWPGHTSGGTLWEGDFQAAPAGPLWGTKTTRLNSPYRRVPLWDGDFRAAPAGPLWGTKTTYVDMI